MFPVGSSPIHVEIGCHCKPESCSRISKYDVVLGLQAPCIVLGLGLGLPSRRIDPNYNCDLARPSSSRLNASDDHRMPWIGEMGAHMDSCLRAESSNGLAALGAVNSLHCVGPRHLANTSGNTFLIVSGTRAKSLALEKRRFKCGRDG